MDIGNVKNSHPVRYKKKGHKEWKQIEVKEAIELLNPDIKELLPLIHAFGGCDTTSSIYDKGKNSILKLIEKSDEAKNQAKLFISTSTSKEDIGMAGNKKIVLLYGGEVEETLPSLRYRLYMKMAASSTKISPSKLPPTDRAAYFHSLRVYLQVTKHI